MMVIECPVVVMMFTFGVRSKDAWYKEQHTITKNIHYACLAYIISSLSYIYNGIIFPSLNPAKIFQFISR